MKFNLIDDPWIPVRDGTGRVRDVSIKECFHQAESTYALGGETPTQQIALLRLLLAIEYRAVGSVLDPDDGVERWTEWWTNGLPLDRIDAYLDNWRHRFFLTGAPDPFMQVAGLTSDSGKTSGLSKMIADVPAGHQFFTQRAGGACERLSPAEAARWVLHCQAFDPSGIKTGASGDLRVVAGKGYPIGIAWTGNLGVVELTGRNLRETLLLNLSFLSPSTSEDLPAWERSSLGPQVETGHPTPRGPADIYTWQSRRILLSWEDEWAVDVLISNGDPLSIQNRHNDEPMSGWRRSPNQEKKSGGTVFMPLQHDPSRQIWRGLSGLLDSAEMGAGNPQQRIRPATVEWLATLTDEGVVSPEYPIRIRTVGVQYGTNNSVIDAMIDDSLDARVATLTTSRLVHLAEQAAAAAEDAVFKGLGGLARDLASATNSDPEGPSTRARESGYAALDDAYRIWFAGLASSVDPAEALDAWYATVRSLLHDEALLQVEASGPKTLVGRNIAPPGDRPRHMDAAKAWARFQNEVAKACPLPPTPTTPPSGKDPS